MKRIYSIVVTYNGMEWIGKCLNSLVRSSYPTKILVVDNGSVDETLPFIQNEFPQVQLIAAGKNLGFGQANNIGMRLAIGDKADYIFLLNQDAWVGAHTLGALVHAQLGQPRYGIVSPIHLNGRGIEPDRYFLDYFIASGGTRELIDAKLRQPRESPARVIAGEGSPRPANKPPAAAEGPALIPTEFVNAAAWLLTAECIRSTGGFDPLFFHYGEDRNYAQRALFKGFAIGICMEARIGHDREQRTLATAPGKFANGEREWEHFLNQACDIRKPGYIGLSVRRALRYTLTGLGHLLSLHPGRARYCFSLAGRIAASFSRIHRSRGVSMRPAPPPHLGP